MSKTPAGRFLPVSRKEMDARGWDACDAVIVNGDAYVDHPSFGAAIIGRVLEQAGFRVGIIPQPDVTDRNAFAIFGEPRLGFLVSAGNVDSMVNNYTANKRMRSDDDYSPGGLPHKRPDRAVTVYCNKIRESFKKTPSHHRRHRGQPAEVRPVRLLGRPGQAVDPRRRPGRSHRLRHGGKVGAGSHATPQGRRSCQQHHRCTGHSL